MIVMKFGGTSLGHAGRILSACQEVVKRRESRPVVVVSAVGGVTDLLLRGVEHALDGDRAATGDVVEELRKRHLDILAVIGLRKEVREQLEGEVDRLIEELDRMYFGIEILGEATARSRDAVLVRGEGLSSRLVTAALNREGDIADCVDATRVMVTNAAHGHARPNTELLAERCRQHVLPLVEKGRIVVLGGFVAATVEGIPTTLGRGGSDYTATLVGVAIGADEVQIWTDVDGMMTADPRIATAARVLATVPYDEAAELAYFGAKVLHPATLRPAVQAGIPVRIKNSLRPAAPGTEITATRAEGYEPTAVATKKRVSLITVSSPRMLMAHGVLARIFAVFDRHETAVDLVATSEVTVSLTVDDATALPAIIEELGESFQVRRVDGCAIVSLVGRGILAQPGIAAKIFSSVKDVNVLMISAGASDINLSFVVREESAELAVKALHRAFFEPDADASGPR